MNAPPDIPPTPGSAVTLAPRKSRKAIAATVLGILSIACSFGLLGVPPAVVAVVLGATALISIKRSNGRLGGNTLAWIGIATGTVGLVLGALMTYKVATGARSASSGSSAAASALRQAETNTISATDGVAYGNSPEAEALAQEYSDLIGAMHGALFTREGDEPSFSLSDGQFVTHCQLDDDSCAFIVHVPSYRHHEEDAKASLRDLAWMIAVQVATSEHLPPGSDLAVGLRGPLLYGAIVTGTSMPTDTGSGDTEADTEAGEDSSGFDDLIRYTGKDSDFLEPFFEPEASAAPDSGDPATPGATPAPEAAPPGNGSLEPGS